jgi:hypothetical protein
MGHIKWGNHGYVGTWTWAGRPSERWAPALEELWVRDPRRKAVIKTEAK